MCNFIMIVKQLQKYIRIKWTVLSYIRGILSQWNGNENYVFGVNEKWSGYNVFTLYST